VSMVTATLQIVGQNNTFLTNWYTTCTSW
jgi:hypothetical protein